MYKKKKKKKKIFRMTSGGFNSYCGVQQDEHHCCADETLEAGVIFVCKHAVEVAGEDTHLVNDQLL